MELIYCLNFITIVYISLTLYRLTFKIDDMTDGVQHHIISHLFIVITAAVALNLYVSEGWIAPMIFSFLYILQHTIKEDNKMMKIGKWTAKVDGGDF